MSELHETINPAKDVPGKPRISSITVGRVYNLGNYENINYKITAEIPEGNNTADVFTQLEQVLEGLNPNNPVGNWEIQRANELLSKPAKELNSYEIEGLENAKERLKRFEAWKGNHVKALELLKSFGGSSKTKLNDHCED